MTELTPTSAYDLLEPLERSAVDEYVKFAVDQQIKKKQRIIAAINLPIPSEYIRRSRDALYKPLLRAAIAERITEVSRSHDISPDRVIEEHGKIAFASVQDFMEQGPYGELVPKALKDWPEDKVGAIKSIETKPGTFGLAVKITMHDKLLSLKTLGELTGLVSPDNPPALSNYVGEKAKSTVLEQAPERAYLELLETVGA